MFFNCTPRRALALLLLLVAAVYMCTLSRGHLWGYGDFSLYIAHARNIAMGWPYSLTGYIYNPLNPYIGPATYPPGFPLALAPVYKLFGLNLIAFKMENVLFLLAALVCVYKIARRGLDESGALAVTALTAFNPWFLDFRNFVYADWLSMLLILLSLLTAGEGLKSRRQGALSGFISWLAYAVRPVGVMALGAVVARELVSARKVSRELLYAVACFALPCLLQYLLMPPMLSVYLVTARSSMVSQEAYHYPLLALKVIKPFFEFFYYDYFHAGFACLLALPLGLFALFLCSVHYRRQYALGRLDALDWFVVLYPLSFLVAYDWQRNFFPVAPLYLYQSFRGAEWLGEKLSPARSRLPAGVFALFVALAYCVANQHDCRSSEREFNVVNSESSRLFSMIRANTAKSDVIICRKPRIMALYALRKSAIYPVSGTEDYFLEYFKAINARYVIAGKMFEPDRLVLLPVLRDTGHFILVYQSENFRVFKIKYK